MNSGLLSRSCGAGVFGEQAAAIEKSGMPRRFINRNNVKRADGVGDSLLVNDHDRFGMDGNKILMRHTDFLAAGQLQSERMKTVLQPASDLFDNHARNLAPPKIESILQLQIRVRHRAERRR